MSWQKKLAELGLTEKELPIKIGTPISCYYNFYVKNYYIKNCLATS
jgi:hypothetical protein